MKLKIAWIGAIMAGMMLSLTPAVFADTTTSEAPAINTATEEAPAWDDSYQSVKVAVDNAGTTVTFGWKYDTADNTLYLDVNGNLPNTFSYDDDDDDALPWNDLKKSVKKVVLGDGFHGIGVKMFENYTALTTVQFPKELTEIADYAFYGCRRLKKLTIPEGVETIGAFAFSDCKKLASIQLPDSLKTLGQYAFSGCDKLKEVTIPEGVETIAANTFIWCSSLTKVQLPQSVTKIKKDAFFYCTALQEINLPDQLTEIGAYAFYQTNLSKVVLPDTLTTLGNYAFAYCEALKTIQIPESINKIPASLLRGCRSLESVVLPSALKQIGSSAFYQCESLLELNIPSTVTKIGADAFSGCKKLTSLSIPEQVTRLASRTFAYCDNLEQITLPKKLSYLGSSVFYGCKKLSAITLPEGIPTIPYGTFANCKSLQTITLPSSVTEVSDAFYGCSKLEKILVDSENPNLISIDGVLLNKDASKILAYPTGKKSASYCVPSTVKTLDFYALPRTKSSSLKVIVVSASTKKFEGSLGSNQILVSSSGSMASLYAKEYDLAYANYSNQKPHTVWNLKSDSYYSYFKLKWSGASSTTGYAVYHYDTAKGKYVRVATTTNKSYKVTRTNQTEKYAVAAFTVGADGTIRYSSWKYITVK